MKTFFKDHYNVALKQNQLLNAALEQKSLPTPELDLQKHLLKFTGYEI